MKEAKELVTLLWELAEKDPTKMITCVVQGLNQKTLEEAQRVLREIFPTVGVAA